MRELGFPPPVCVAGRYSIADLFPRSGKRCGIYLLEFADQTFYIGQAIDVVRRYSQHRVTYSDIVNLSFRAVDRKNLNEVEQDLIHQAERRGLRLRNIVHAAFIQADSDLDDLVSRSEQDIWLLDPAALSFDRKRTAIAVSEEHRLRYECQFRIFQQHPCASAIIAALRAYVSQCIIAPHLTEYSFWAVSCLPSTNRQSYPRLSVINAGPMETCVIGHHLNEPTAIWAFINIAASVFGQAYPAFGRFRRTYGPSNVDIVTSHYQSAGFDQLQIRIEGIEHVKKVLGNAVVRSAARSLSLRMMRKQATLFGRYHAFALADQILGAT